MFKQQENESDCGVFAIAFSKCLLEGKDPSEYDFVNPRKHLAQYLPQGNIPEFPKVLAQIFWKGFFTSNSSQYQRIFKNMK